jgi:hypothetical protein
VLHTINLPAATSARHVNLSRLGQEHHTAAVIASPWFLLPVQS